MEFIREENQLRIKINQEEWDELNEEDNDDTLGFDNARFDFFEEFIANSEWEWISPLEISALTDAPILGIKDENDEVIECYGFMDYQVISLVYQLYNCKEAILQKG